MKSARAKLTMAAIGLACTLLLATFAASGVDDTAKPIDTRASAPGPAAQRSLPSQVDSAGGVSVKVTPRKLARDAASWEFAVALDTHSQELSQDMSRSAALIDAQGSRHAPLGWEGAAPGGHHREGVLKFRPLEQADVIVLEVNGIGGVAVRTFRWQLN
jgi:hypothetical protein